MQNRSLLSVALILAIFAIASLHAAPLKREGSKVIQTPFDDDDKTVDATLSVGNSSSGNATGCDKYLTCSDCTGPYDCVWCESNNKCLDGNVWGPTHHIFSGCDDWRWQQCKVNGRVVFWVSGAGVCLLILLFFMCCCICCVCRVRRARSYKYSSAKSWQQLQEEESEINNKRTNDRASARALLREKYGISDDRRASRGRNNF